VGSVARARDGVHKMPPFWLSPFLYCNLLLSAKEIITTLHIFFSHNGSYGKVELADSYGKSG
jgi:hypothetical protein